MYTRTPAQLRSDIGAVGGTGTEHYVARWTATAGVLGTGVLYDNGTNVGVGTTTVGARITLADHTTASGGIRFRTEATAVDLYSTGSAVLKTGANFEALSYRVGTTETITSGRLGRFANGSASAPAYSFTSNTGLGMYRGGTNILSFSTNGAQRIRVTASGVTNFGSASSQGVSGDISVARTGSSYAGEGAVFFGTGANYLYWTGTRFAKTGTSGWMENSDMRIKTGVQEVPYGLEEILALSPSMYNLHQYNFDGGVLSVSMESVSDIGFIAQEVYNIIPEMVNKPENESESLWTLNYNPLVPILVRAVQEQQQMIGGINTNTNELLAKVQQLESQINNLNQEPNPLNSVLSITSTNTLTVDSHLLSKTNNTYNLGSSTNRWKNVYTQGVISIGENGNSGSVKYDTETKELKFSNDGTNWIALGSTTNTETLSAQYPGSVVTSKDIETGVGEEETGHMHYYEFNNIEEDTESVEISIRYTLPSNFASWSDNAIQLNYATECMDDEDCSVDMEVFKQETPNKKGKSLTNVGLQPEEWETILLSGNQLKNTCTEPGDTCIIIIRLHSKDNNYVRVGDIKFDYNRKL